MGGGAGALPRRHRRLTGWWTRQKGKASQPWGRAHPTPPHPSAFRAGCSAPTEGGQLREGWTPGQMPLHLLQDMPALTTSAGKKRNPSQNVSVLRTGLHLSHLRIPRPGTEVPGLIGTIHWASAVCQALYIHHLVSVNIFFKQMSGKS